MEFYLEYNNKQANTIKYQVELKLIPKCQVNTVTSCKIRSLHLFKTQLIKDCIGLLHHEDLFVTVLVFDGIFGNQSTATQLGCIMDLSNIQTWFPHPQIPNAKVHVIFGVCHMIKLM